MEPQEYESIKEFYGLDENTKDLFFVRDNAGRKVLLVTEGLNKFLKADTVGKIKLVNMGCTAFEKGKESFAGHFCLYRLCQEGIHFTIDLITKRKVKVTLKFFKQMLELNSIPHEQIEDE